MRALSMLPAVLAICSALSMPAYAERRAPPNKPPGSPGTFAGYDPEALEFGCLIGYVWTNVTPEGKKGPDGYQRRVWDGQAALCTGGMRFMMQ